VTPAGRRPRQDAYGIMYAVLLHAVIAEELGARHPLHKDIGPDADLFRRLTVRVIDRVIDFARQLTVRVVARASVDDEAFVLEEEAAAPLLDEGKRRARRDRPCCPRRRALRRPLPGRRRHRHAHQGRRGERGATSSAPTSPTTWR